MKNWSQQQSAVLGRLRRVEGQVRALSGMVERGEDCEQIAQQMAAARKALDRAFFDMLACMTQRELQRAGVDTPAALRRLARVSELLTRYG